MQRLKRWVGKERPTDDMRVQIEHVDEADEPLPEQIYLDAARHYLDTQLGSFDLLDTRSNQVFSLGSVALPLTFALLNLGSNRIAIPDEAKWALVIGLAVYILLVICVFFAGSVRSLQYRPDMMTLERHSESLPGPALLRWVAIEYRTSTERNKDSLRKKGVLVGAATLLLYLEGLSLAIAALLTLDIIGTVLPWG